ncbi:MAG: 3-methyl-2-oxobutanoate hydroxymethyltransferase [Legionellaceae bacterium]|nr:3-methyl-2-oxobutanoate hydroxymethyltransferase [Legionellaceae bacterium]
MKLHDFKRKKENNSKISMLTCYDYPSACIIAESNIDCVLVGDSVAMAMHGHTSTIMATMEMMVLHTSAVARGLNKQFLVSDLPFLCHRGSQVETIQNVRRLLQAGAHAIKIEGGDPDVCQTIAHLVASGIPVMGHIGLTPQSVLQLGGYKVQGREQERASQLLQQAHDLEKAGCFALVIECVPSALGEAITQSLTIPTIGIGAGVNTDGQVLVWHDMLGLQSEVNFRFVKRFVLGKDVLLTAINLYADEVRQVQFPAAEHVF